MLEWGCWLLLCLNFVVIVVVLVEFESLVFVVFCIAVLLMDAVFAGVISEWELLLLLLFFTSLMLSQCLLVNGYCGLLQCFVLL